ncbi:predicted protein [Histoplasma mississippiense (nom. inval.)]|uniref:predicted protein n=1 Tax=Ajellomyces capsulatus (strain NAm1 / WU24) TaxID=2059318 RepID=UPI000157CFE3|nr:predicted protein [Histoplasma mississippiense (nom. inval.)]EDN11203.1 predicted protein [Histoplasma mississippiense (nom. inval.)]
MQKCKFPKLCTRYNFTSIYRYLYTIHLPPLCLKNYYWPAPNAQFGICIALQQKYVDR